MSEIDILNQGGALLYPTDTIWGLGCDATNPIAIDKIIKIKGRQSEKSFIVLARDIDMLRQYVEEIPQAAEDLLHSIKEPLTIIYQHARNLPVSKLSHNNSIGIRIPQHAYCQKLLQAFGKPIVSTSANISGMPSPKSYSDIDQKIKDEVDFIADEEREKISASQGSQIYIITADNSIKRLR
ncbi:MAG: threonylcarbamoyl-AMP synthase [Bacteroidales bacterium]|nr:threonylcarbamoyl-AMP synthase [Bacteroidales bacterium]